jgi:23S rRNA pseudouridine2605 synthase
MQKDKIQKVLASLGVASRRTVESMISQGKVEVNGAKAILGDRISQKDKVKVNDISIDTKNYFNKSDSTILMYNKPEGEVCTHFDEEDRPLIYDSLPRCPVGKWESIGRLDINTSGLLLVTNDGEIQNQLSHPKYGLEREYLIRIYGEVTPQILNNLTKGIKLEDGVSYFESFIEISSNGNHSWWTGVVNQGKNRIVRRLIESQGLLVSRLKRIRFGKLTLPKDLRRGQFRKVDLKEIIG